MRTAALLATLLGAGCYQAPATPCTIACSDTCPDGLSCVDGLCTTPGQACDGTPTPLPRFTHVSVGARSACAIAEDTSLWCWGDNQYGQLGLGDTTARLHPTQVPGPAGWRVIELGLDHACGIRAEELFCWGRNDQFQVGTDGADTTSPVDVDPTGAVAAWSGLAAGLAHSCGIGDGRLFCWGDNTFGQLGTGDTQARRAPTQIGADADWRAVSASDHTCGLRPDGVRCWGNNDYSQLAIDSRGNPPPVRTPEVEPIGFGGKSPQAISVGRHLSCALHDDSTAECWGRGSEGQLGLTWDAAMDDRSAFPHPLADDARSNLGWARLAASDTLVCGRRDDRLTCAGSSRTGGLANGEVTPYRQFAPDLDEVDELDLSPGRGAETGCLLRQGRLSCWGDNRFGQLGDGHSTLAQTPREVPQVAGPWSELSMGQVHLCAAGAGAYYCWGDDQEGAVTGVPRGGVDSPCESASCAVSVPTPARLPDGLTTLHQLQAGGRNTCTRHDRGPVTGEVTCWGAPWWTGPGGTGAGRNSFRGADGAPLVELRVDGSVGCVRTEVGANPGWSCWHNFAGPPSALTPLLVPGIDGLAASVSDTPEARTACVVEPTTFDVWCWGDNQWSQFGDGGTASNPAPAQVGHQAHHVDLGLDHGCGVTPAGNVACWGGNDAGETGEAVGGVRTATPVLVVGDGEPLASCGDVATGMEHSCATCGGTLWCWGGNRSGQLGRGHLDAGSTPHLAERVVVPPALAGEAWVELQAGVDLTCARSDTGRLACWGLGASGELGDGGFTAVRPTPVVGAPR